MQFRKSRRRLLGAGDGARLQAQYPPDLGNVDAVARHLAAHRVCRITHRVQAFLDPVVPGLGGVEYVPEGLDFIAQILHSRRIGRRLGNRPSASTCA